MSEPRVHAEVEAAVRRERRLIAEALELAIRVEGGPAKLLAELRKAETDSAREAARGSR